MIDIVSATKVSLRALRTNKLRSALTMLGIIIGVSAVITMLSVGQGATSKLNDQIASMGSNLLIVVPGASTSGGMRMGAGSQSTLTIWDAEAIKRECKSVMAVGPVVGGTAQVVFGNLNWSTGITGSTSEMFTVRDWSLSEGRMFTDQDERNATKTAIIGQTIVDNLFGSIDPVGQIIRIKNIPFTVIGVLEPKGQSAMGQDQDDVIYIPISTAMKRLFGTQMPGQIRVIMIKAFSLDALDSAQREITDLLHYRHHIQPKQDDDFTVRNLTQLMQSAQSIALIMSLLLGSIAGISLLVGGIGIMNIMLVSVTERTREIGIRLAVGAKTWDIRMQFIVEALTLSIMGGVVGIIIGFGFAKLISSLANWPTIITPVSMVMSFGFSAAVGIFFGFYPAYKASMMNPIDALRYE